MTVKSTFVKILPLLECFLIFSVDNTALSEKNVKSICN